MCPVSIIVGGVIQDGRKDTGAACLLKQVTTDCCSQLCNKAGKPLWLQTQDFLHWLEYLHTRTHNKKCPANFYRVVNLINQHNTKIHCWTKHRITIPVCGVRGRHYSINQKSKKKLSLKVQLLNYCAHITRCCQNSSPGLFCLGGKFHTCSF